MKSTAAIFLVKREKNVAKLHPFLISSLNVTFKHKIDPRIEFEPHFSPFEAISNVFKKR